MIPLAYVAMCLIWGTTWLAIKLGLDGVPPFLGAGLRFAIATVLVGLVLVVRRTAVRPTRGDVISILSQGLLVFWLNYAAVYWAEMRISSGLTAVLFSTMPLTTALLSRFWTRSETLDARAFSGIGIGMMGTLLLFWPDDRLGAAQIPGMVAALCASISSSIALVVLKRHGGRTDPFMLNTFAMGLGAACLLAMSGLLERGTNVDWTVLNVGALFYLAIFGSVVAFSLYYWLIKRLDATVVSMSTLITPVIALVVGRVFLDEVMTPLALAGIATILAGVTVAIAPVGRRG
jgi:drug/metabolite transporter (DMT)-like permease